MSCPIPIVLLFLPALMVSCGVMSSRGLLELSQDGSHVKAYKDAPMLLEEQPLSSHEINQLKDRVVKSLSESSEITLPIKDLIVLIRIMKIKRGIKPGVPDIRFLKILTSVKLINKGTGEEMASGILEGFARGEEFRRSWKDLKLDALSQISEKALKLIEWTLSGRSGSAPGFVSFVPGRGMVHDIKGFSEALAIPAQESKGEKGPLKRLITSDRRYVWCILGRSLYRYELGRDEWRIIGDAHGLTGGRINFVSSDEGKVWVGTERGLFVSETGGQTWREYLGGHDVLSICFDNVYLWIGTSEGLWRLERSSQRLEKVMELGDQPIWSLTGSNEWIWAGTSNGIKGYDRGLRKWEGFESDDEVRWILEMGGVLWLVTGKGLSMFDPKAKKAISYDERDGLPSTDIRCVCTDGNIIWIATGSGICRYDRITNSFMRFLPERNLPTLAVNWISCGTEEVWFATDLGVSRYDRRTGHITNYLRSSGLSEGSILSVEIVQDKVFAVTEEGVCYYEPSLDIWRNVKE